MFFPHGATDILKIENFYSKCPWSFFMDYAVHFSIALKIGIISFPVNASNMRPSRQFSIPSAVVLIL
jgi:hypothetical protein